MASKVGSIEIMDRKKYNLIFLALVLFIGCAKKNPAQTEEHTSELQSHHDLVCRLLLEKKKK